MPLRRTGDPSLAAAAAVAHAPPPSMQLQLLPAVVTMRIKHVALAGWLFVPLAIWDTWKRHRGA